MALSPFTRVTSTAESLWTTRNTVAGVDLPSFFCFAAYVPEKSGFAAAHAHTPYQRSTAHPFFGNVNIICPKHHQQRSTSQLYLPRQGFNDDEKGAEFGSA